MSRLPTSRAPEAWALGIFLPPDRGRGALRRSGTLGTGDRSPALGASPGEGTCGAPDRCATPSPAPRAPLPARDGGGRRRVEERFGTELPAAGLARGARGQREQALALFRPAIAARGGPAAAG